MSLVMLLSTDVLLVRVIGLTSTILPTAPICGDREGKHNNECSEERWAVPTGLYSGTGGHGSVDLAKDTRIRLK